MDRERERERETDRQTERACRLVKSLHLLTELSHEILSIVL